MESADQLSIGRQLLPFQQELLSQATHQPPKQSRVQHLGTPSLLPPAEIHARRQVRVVLQRRAGTLKGQQTFHKEQICAYSARINRKCASGAHDQDVCFSLGFAYENLFKGYAAWIRSGEMPKPASEPLVSDKERLEFFVHLHSLARYMEDARLQSGCTDAIIQMAHDGDLNALTTEARHIRVAKGFFHGSTFRRLFFDIENAHLGGTVGGKLLQKVVSIVGCKGISKDLEAARQRKQREALDTLEKPCAYHKHDGLFPERVCREKVLDGAVVRYPDVPLAAFATGSVVRHYSHFDPPFSPPMK